MILKKRNDHTMIEKIINHPITIAAIKIAAISHLCLLSINLIDASKLPPLVSSSIFEYLELSMLFLVFILVLNGMYTFVKKIDAFVSYELAREVFIICTTLLLTSFIFLDGEVDEESIMFFTKELPLKTWHIKLLTDLALAYFMYGEITQVYSYSKHSLEKDFAQSEISSYSSVFFVKVLMILGALLTSAKIFNIDKLAHHLANYILHVLHIAVYCMIGALVIDFIMQSMITMKKKSA